MLFFKKKKLLKKEQDPSFQIRFLEVTLRPFIHSLSLNIPQGAWIHLEDKNELEASIFCDLCFGFLYPEEGMVESSIGGHHVSFLGKGPTTYGNTLLEHLSYATINMKKTTLMETVEKILSSALLRKISTSSSHASKLDKNIRNIHITEKEYMEISEANSILQNRKAAVININTKFYQNALRQGFVHSRMFLHSGKTIFWVGNNKNTTNYKFLKEQNTPTLSVDFSYESPLVNTS